MAGRVTARVAGTRIRRVRRFRDGRGTLLRDGEPVAAVEIAASSRSRRRGLLGRDGIDGAMLLTASASVHTVGMRFGLDVAYLAGDLRVISVVSMRPNRVGMVRPRARHVLEAERGAFARWGIRPGVHLAVSG